MEPDPGPGRRAPSERSYGSHPHRTDAGDRVSAVAYERWFGAGTSDHREIPVALIALRAARLDSFLADSQDDGVVVLDAAGRIIESNPALERRSGFTRSETIGRTLADLVVADHRRRVETAVDDALTGDGVRVRARGAKRSGDWCELAITLVPLFDEQRAVVGALVITQNLSEAEEAAHDRQRDARLRELAGRIAGVTGWSLELATGAVDWTGRDDASVSPRTLDDVRELLDAADAARLTRAIERAERERRMLDLTVTVRVGAQERHIRLVGEYAEAVGARRGILHGAAHDITDVVIEQRHRERVEQLLGTTLDAMTDGLGIVDAAWRITFVNERLAAMLGREREALLGSALWEAVPELGGTELEIAFREAVERGETVRVRDRVHARDAWIEAIAYPSAGGLAVLLRDVTDAERAAERYREAQVELTTLGSLLDIAREAIVVSDAAQGVRYANAGARELYGWSDLELEGRHLRELVHVDEEAMERAWRVVLERGHWAGRVSARTLDGRRLTLASRMQLIPDAENGRGMVLSVASDVTEEVAREESQRRTERLESLGTFAGGIAHDLNNVLTPILMASQLLGAGLERPADREAAAMIEGAARRGADMVRQVLAFARGVEHRGERVDVAPLLDELRAMLADTVPARVRLSIVGPPSPVAVQGDATQLLQVLANLVRNAVDAIADEGEVRVDARLDADGDERLVLTVADTGHGMPPEVIARLWEPFFTTKEAGRGTGLGLVMVAAIVRAHGGTIAAESDGATGSRFTIALPVLEAGEATAGEGPGAAQPAPRGRGELVLVVDDEADIRAVLRQALREHGYEVAVAAGGDDAATLVAEGRVRPDLVLSDVMMPGGSGLELADRLAETGIPVLLMSGRHDPAEVPERAATAVVGFLHKPLTASDLLVAIGEAITATTTRHPRSPR